jgi:hypothetical protein
VNTALDGRSRGPNLPQTAKLILVNRPEDPVAASTALTPVASPTTGLSSQERAASPYPPWTVQEPIPGAGRKA